MIALAPRLRVIAAMGLALAAPACSWVDYTPKPLVNVTIPALDTSPKKRYFAKEQPPAASAQRPLRAPKATWAELPNGLKVATIPGKSWPVAEVRVLALGGSAADGERPGLASITAKLMVEGGVAPVEALGAALSAEVTDDAIELRLSATADQLDAAIDLAGAMIARPALAEGALDKLKKREIQRASDLARSSAPWAAGMMIRRELFTLPADHHPYASFAATAEDLAKIKPGDVRALHKRAFVPKNMVVIIAGDVPSDAAMAAARRAFGGLRGGEPPVVSFTDPSQLDRLKITVIDRPKAAYADLYAAMLGPARSDKTFASYAVLAELLGGQGGRLASDLGDARALSLDVGGKVTELARGPSLLTLHVGVAPDKVFTAAQGLFEHVDRLAETAPTAAEVDGAARSLTGLLSSRFESIGGAASELGRLKALGLPDEHLDAFGKELMNVTPALVNKAGGDHMRKGRAVLVAVGPAASIGPMLARFGEVRVVDATRGFERIKTIPHARGD